MSSTAQGKLCVSRKNAKPNYVKKLNFGETILSSTNTSSLNINAEHNEWDENQLLHTDSIAGTSLGAKRDFVRQWIETQDESALSPVVDDDHFSLQQSSPILGSSSTKRVERSPVLGNIKKRPKSNIGLNYGVEDENDLLTCVSRNDLSSQDIIGNSIICGDQIRSQSRCPKGTDLKETVHSQIKNFSDKCYITSENTLQTTSPTLDRSYAYKRRKRKYEKDQNKCTLENNIWIETQPYKVLNAASGTQNIKSDIHIPLPNKYLKNEEASLQSVINKEFSESICILDINPPLCSQKQEEILESPVSIKSSLRVVIESCDGVEHEEYKEKLNISNSDSDKTITNLIEDVDSQDVIPIKEVPSTYGKSLLSTCSSTLRCSNASTRNSDETFCSKAEAIIKNEKLNAQTLQKIVQTPSLSSGTRKSSQADIIISLCPSPLKVVTDALKLNTLDSGKKRKKPKKGTIAERLQSLVSRQTSCVRIWRHQIKNKIDNASVQYVTVQVQTCSMHYGRQFLEGFVIQDRSNLLRDYIGTGTHMESDVQEPLAKKMYLGITIMIVPSLVGKIQMRAEGVIKIYPPWEIVDNMKSIINVMYLSIVPPDESNDILITGMLSKVNQQSSEEFNCPCIESGVFSHSCETHKMINKPCPMMQLFK